MKNLTSIVLILLALCFSSVPWAFAQQSTLMHQIVPSDTDRRIDTFTADGYMHWSWCNPGVPDRHQLVVFLPGTGGRGQGSAAFNEAAAQWGFHVISLIYPDDVSISVLKRSDDRAAYSKARYNVITGRAPYQQFNVSEPNSIENRLVSVVRYLAKTYPGEHWEQFLDSEKNVAWDKTILAGQSQGGGHACYMALKLHKVAKVLMFGAPKDFSGYFHEPSAWLSEGTVTPLDRLFCFNHSDDGHNGCTYPQQLMNYQALRLVPTYNVVNVDASAPPYGHTRLLTSTTPRPNAHNAPVHDPMYRQAWQYMLFEPVQ